MPPREWFIRLEDILEAIERLEASLAGLSYDEFERNHDKRDAAIRNLTVIGEAANHVPEEIQQTYSSIPWAKIVAMRNFVIHEYFGITLKVIWDTAVEALPDLKKEISKIVSAGRPPVVTKKKRTLKRRPRSKRKKS